MLSTNTHITKTNVFSALFAALFSIALSSPGSARSVTAEQQPDLAQAKIQIAILLDTSSSMSGLINQTRDQLWNVVNEFTQSHKNGLTPTLEVSVYEYGNDNLSQNDGYTRQVSPLTTELDQVSEALFSLSTNGGSEYCGYVISEAVNELNWSQSQNDIKIVFIAGNEEFTQGPIPYRQAVESAIAKGIIVNTIHAGDHATGANTGWQDGALLAGGNYSSIDHNHKVAHIVAPQDKRIAELNQELNKTYIPYGDAGVEKAERQQAQDANNANISIGLLAKRVKSKVSSLYNNAKWDLVDALKSGEVDLDKLSEEELPDTMQGMNNKERVIYVQQNADQRQKIQSEIVKLSKERDNYVAEQKKNSAAPASPTMEEAVITSVRNIGQSKGLKFN